MGPLEIYSYQRVVIDGAGSQQICGDFIIAQNDGQTLCQHDDRPQSNSGGSLTIKNVQKGSALRNLTIRDPSNHDENFRRCKIGRATAVLDLTDAGNLAVAPAALTTVLANSFNAILSPAAS